MGLRGFERKLRVNDTTKKGDLGKKYERKKRVEGRPLDSGGREGERESDQQKDGPGPVMVSDTL